MNILTGEIIDIKSLERLNAVKFKVGSQIVNVLMLEMNMELKIGKKAELLIKPTALSIACNKFRFENCLKGKIISVSKGKILSSVIVETENFEIEIITLNECAEFENENVYLFFKANDVAIGKVF